MTNKLSKAISKIKEKSERFNGQLEALDREIKITENEMEKLNDELVEMQLEGDFSGQDHHIKKKLKELSLQLAEQETTKESYKRVAQKGLVGDKERREIKSIIEKEDLIRSSNLEKMQEEKQQALQKIEELKNQVKVLDVRYSQEHGNKERNLRMIEDILKEIDPRAVQLDRQDKNMFVKHWLADGEVNSFLKKPEARTVREVIDLGPKREVKVATANQQPVREVQKVASWLRP